MNSQFDVIVPDGEDPVQVYRELLVEMADYYESALAVRTEERDFHESQSFVYIEEIARLVHVQQQDRIGIVDRAKRRIKRVLRGLIR
ncbi:hypothetical protein [Demequina sp.]|uniref:hypothetical protein n=1 Tax=Demequina sp. TaxID=2050685 RepID=UPI0025BDC01D|nr:hypothetical protein [Demequina sp.]